MKKNIILAITGASGSIYAEMLMQKLAASKKQIESCGVIFSDNAKDIWLHEIGKDSFKKIPFKIYDKKDFTAPFASGSAGFGPMIICPCSMGVLGRIASGVSDDLITRAADVILKEKKQLILVTRESPLSLIHINNMKTVTEAGGIVCPANPSFYRKPETIEDLVASVVERIMDLAGFETGAYRWGKH